MGTIEVYVNDGDSNCIRFVQQEEVPGGLEAALCTSARSTAGECEM